MNIYCDAPRLYIFIQLATNCFGYYWRDYHGRVPEDAFIAGTDLNNKNIYIGQVFVTANQRQAILPATIKEGKDTFAPFYGAQRSDSFCQILCTTDKNFYKWIPTDSAHIHLLPINYKFVWGGVENKQLVAIGRISYQGSVVVGKVLSGLVENARMFYVHNGKEIAVTTYEVLTYNGTESFSKSVEAL